MKEANGRPKVLVVDDEPQILDSIHDLLEDDFDVLTCDDATEAINLLKDSEIIVILADQRMPKLSGDQFLATAQRMSQASRILVTGYADIEALIRSVNDGQIHSYVPKPWDPAALRITVVKAATHAKEALRRRQAAETVAEQQQALARSEAAYREQTTLLRSVLDSMSEGVLVTDGTGNILVANPAAAGMVGADAGERHYADLTARLGICVPGTDTPYPEEDLPLARAMRGETADGVELQIRNTKRPDGLYVSVNVRPLKDESGGINGGVAVVRDITMAKHSEEALRKAKEEAERANRAKSAFLSRMSHELRTPLNAILGFAQLLAMSDASPKFQDNVQHILKGGTHLLQLINEVLDLARVEAGRLALTLEPVRIEDVVTDAVDLIKPIAGAQDIKFSADLGGYADTCVLADRQRLKQALLNLISNAIKFNRPNGKVQLTCRQNVPDRLVVEVADTGAGIDEAGLKKVFTPFERLDADKRAVGGTGLGLALSRSMIEAMGGTMGAASTEGVGSTFFFELALAETVARPASEDSRSMEVVSGVDSSLEGAVLYIEDNVANISLVTAILQRYPHIRLQVARDGASGIELARTQSPDWILLDLHLPDMAGEEVLRRLKIDSRTAAVPIAILSADASPNRIGALKESAGCEYLTKPIDVRRFMELLQRTLRRNQTGEAAPDERAAVSVSGARPVSSGASDQATEPVSFDRLPDELVRQMRLAVAQGKKNKLGELIATVADQDVRCADVLRQMADNYDYDSLTALLSSSR